MATTRLRSPIPRRRLIDTPALPLPTRATQRMVPPAQSSHVDVFAVLSERRTRRHFGTLSAADLSAFLWHAARTRVSYLDETGRRVESRPAPSAGACHPHDILIVRDGKRGPTATLYDPRAHALSEVVCRRGLVRHFSLQVSEIVPVGRGTILWLVGQPQRTADRYRHPESLLWRDAGVLLGVMALVAEALGLAFCPVGMTGDPYVSKLVGARGGISGFGGAILGAAAKVRQR